MPPQRPLSETRIGKNGCEIPGLEFKRPQGLTKLYSRLNIPSSDSSIISAKFAAGAGDVSTPVESP